MPTYRYVCPDNHTVTRFCTIAEMEAWEAYYQTCPACAQKLTRDLTLGSRHITFHEGFYEHISQEGKYISSMDDLKRTALAHGNYSNYAQDLGGAFPGSREGRWV